MQRKFIVLTGASGWQVGLQRTIPAAPDRAWSWLLSPTGLQAWLGAADALPLAAGESYSTEDGASGEVLIVEPLEQLRLTVQQAGWEHLSTVHIRLTAVESGPTTVNVHHEQLASEEIRGAVKERWETALRQLAADSVG